MLKLIDIVKNYGKDENVVTALKGVSLEFRKNEFVSILGQSGCGKTTMLNIVGGLDRYTSGNLIIDGVETKKYSDVDWDLYRNKRVGFIFQSYNLISHISILSNVEMALTLSGVGKKERNERALKALADVGLSDQANKKPNQLSGGQMQRVSIARALINNPHIVLADEPTGALDSETSKQIMDILKEISNDRLIIMVTHNSELAQQYSTRIIKLNDGLVVGDTNPYHEQQVTVAENAKTTITAIVGEYNEGDIENVVNVVANSNENNDTDSDRNDKKVMSTKKDKVVLTKEEKLAIKLKNKAKKMSLKKTSMNIFTALKLSFNNLMTKKGRTFMTAFAGSIGIIGVALVLAISNGFSGYIKTMQTEMLAGYPITIASSDIDSEKMMAIMMGGDMMTEDMKNKFPSDSILFPKNPGDLMKQIQIENTITKEYVEYLKKLAEKKDWVNSIRYSYNIEMNIIGEIDNTFGKYMGFEKFAKVNYKASMQENLIGMSMGVSANWQEMSGDEAFILENYDVLSGTFPKNKNQVAFVIGDDNKVNQSILAAMNLPYAETEKINFDKVLGKDGSKGVGFKLVMNDEFYKSVDSGNKKFAENNIEDLYKSTDEKIENLDVSCILRVKKDAKLATLDAGIAYTNELTRYVLNNAIGSKIVAAQLANETFNVSTGLPFMEGGRKVYLEKIGATDIPSYINIYPTDFPAKEEIKTYLNDWNVGKADADKITFTDMSKVITEFMNKIVNIISIVLICFAAVSLVVSSVMIGIITYVSVVERTKEIGILRSLGARKFDISNVFNAETSIIGFIAGMIGIIITYILSIPINLIVNAKMAVPNICMLNPWHALIMVVLSVGLTIIAGLVPSRIASKKDPVIALRTD